MREWLIAIGVLVFLGIVLDGVRRMRSASRDSLQMSLNMQKGIEGDGLAGKDSAPERDQYGPEFPSGGARVKFREGGAPEASASPDSKTPSKSGPDSVSARKEPSLDTHAVDTGEPVPMLMDADHEDDDDSPASFSEPQERDLFPEGETGVLSKTRVVKRQEQVIEGGATGDDDLQEVIVINVMSRNDQGMDGALLLETILSGGMRFGMMNIFHYFGEEEAGSDKPLYSMANILKPGTFDLNSMDSFKTPGVSFFLTLPLASSDASAMDAFDSMLSVAKAVASSLDGELKDENRSVMTGQTIEHCRQRISDFALKKMKANSSFSAS
jgi:cell division protein ZipA